MSDGGAQVIVKVGEGVVQLARFRVGRVVLWFTAAWLALSAITANRESGSFLFFLAVSIALVALVGHFIAERRRLAERATLRHALMFVGLVIVSLLGGVFLAFRKKRGDEPPPPSEAEIDGLLR
ncbi:MAG: hypothetical protein Q8K32_17760 [Archangium sp.]|nr:hypothetical protein [Archangium sp.]